MGKGFQGAMLRAMRVENGSRSTLYTLRFIPTRY